MNLRQKIQSLSVRDLKGEARGMPFAICAFAGDSAYADLIKNELEQAPIRVADGDDKSAPLAAMLSGKRDGSFSIDQTANIGGSLGIKALDASIIGHGGLLMTKASSLFQQWLAN